MSFRELQSTFSAGFEARSSAIRDGGREIARILGNALRTLQLGRASPAWTAFLAHITTTIVGGLRSAALLSLQHLLSLVISLSCFYMSLEARWTSAKLCARCRLHVSKVPEHQSLRVS